MFERPVCLSSISLTARSFKCPPPCCWYLKLRQANGTPEKMNISSEKQDKLHFSVSVSILKVGFVACWVSLWPFRPLFCNGNQTCLLVCMAYICPSQAYYMLCVCIMVIAQSPRDSCICLYRQSSSIHNII